MLSFINRNIIYPAYWKWNRDNRLELLAKAEKQQWDSRDEIVERQFRALKSIVKYAYAHVKYYKRVFDEHGIRPDDIHAPSDVKRIPILTKQDIQNNLDDLLSDACPESRRYKDASGGSTGRPTVLFLDWGALPRKFAALLMSDQRTGWKIGEKVVFLWGADREAGIKQFKERLVHRFVYRHETLNAFAMTENDMLRFALRMLSSKPSLIVAYTNVAYLFAQYLQNNKVSGIRPKGIVCSAETLSDEKRKLIESTFQCKVYNRYGSREVGLIASECDRQEGLHINADDIYVEIEPLGKTAGSNGHAGEVVVTDLLNHVMPLIRYNMCDLAVAGKSQCSCGRGQPLIGNVTGRISDFITHPNGHLIHGESFSHAFYGLKAIRQFQILQNKLDTLEVKIAVSGALEPSIKNHILNKMHEIMGDTVDISVSVVENILTPPSGKFRFVISNLAVKRSR